ncbi:alpha/beta hydrolase [Streptomyces sp. NPDC048737]|uniref:alpha/beta hydrolase n=1 Tax=unclassified Streptomyces TaxID=2593676 RepID=UPI0034440A0A
MPRTVVRMPLRGTAGAAAGALVMLLGAVGPASAGGPGGDVGVVLRWKPCEGEAQTEFECAVANVPLDHTRPGHRTIELAVIRHRAAEPAGRAGTLFFNPGGPGGPGTVGLPELYEKFPRELRDRYDIVSWDPRGVGESTAVRCFATAEEAAARQTEVPPFPVGEREQRAFTAAHADLARRCEQRDPELLRHISTADTARDLELLRRATGQERLDYWGISYGTLLGATYANLFPERVGRLVLDGNVDPRAWVDRGATGEPGPNTFLRLGSHVGSADTLEQFLGHCGRAPVTECVFSAGSPAATRAKYHSLLRRLAKRPVGGWTYARTVSEVRGGLYTVHPGWAGIADTLQGLWDGRAPVETGATPAEPVRYPGFEQSVAVLCAESPNPRSPDRYPALERRAVAEAGALGSWWAWANEPCAGWPARAARAYTGPWDRPTAHPVLVVNSTHDPSTPYRSGRAMAMELGRARLLTVDGYGHTALDNPSACVGRHVVRYFLTGALPPVGVRCAQDLPPFVERGPEPTALPASAGTPTRTGTPTPTRTGPPPGPPEPLLPAYGVWPPEVVSGLLPPPHATVAAGRR